MIRTIVMILGLLLLFGGCTSGEKPVPVTVPMPGPLEQLGQPNATWEARWARTLAEARKEGTVVVIGGSTAAALKLEAASRFKEKFGIDIEAISGRGSDVVTRITSERRAGLFLHDVYASGPGSIYQYLKPQGAIDFLEPQFIFPEVIDPGGWLEGKFDWGDKDRMVFFWAATPVVPIMINTDIIQSSQITSWKDLLNPRWKGKIAMNDPTIAGDANSGFIDMVYNKVVELDFFRRLLKDQEAAIQRDQILLQTWLVRGKYPIIVWPNIGRLGEYLQAGAPIASVIPEEGVPVRAPGAAISIMNRAPHPNAATVFINWFLSKEGQFLMQKAAQKQSRRIDISTEGMMAGETRQPGKKYLPSPYGSEKFTLEDEPEYLKLVKEIFTPAR